MTMQQVEMHIYTHHFAGQYVPNPLLSSGTLDHTDRIVGRCHWPYLTNGRLAIVNCLPVHWVSMGRYARTGQYIEHLLTCITVQ